MDDLLYSAVLLIADKGEGICGKTLGDSEGLEQLN
jgi:hypothetical protein